MIFTTVIIFILKTLKTTTSTLTKAKFSSFEIKYQMEILIQESVDSSNILE
jgi:hypothetical protein